MIWPLFNSLAEICQIFHWFLGKSSTPKKHSEIKWPLLLQKPQRLELEYIEAIRQSFIWFIGEYTVIIQSNCNFWWATTTDKRTDVWSGPSCIYTQIFSPNKTWFFLHKKYFPSFFWILFTFILCNFSVQTFFKKILNWFFVCKNWKKNGPQKLLIIGPDPFIS